MPIAPPVNLISIDVALTQSGALIRWHINPAHVVKIHDDYYTKDLQRYEAHPSPDIPWIRRVTITTLDGSNLVLEDQAAMKFLAAMGMT